MKKYIFSGGLFLFILMLVNCSDMNDLHQEYLDEGEIVYSARVDTIIVWSGYKRQLLELEYSTKRIVSATVLWNNGLDSLEFELPQLYVEPLIVTLPDMPEGDYTYHLVTYDSFGNRSIPDEFNGKVYGDSYIASLTNKMLSEVNVTTNDGEHFITTLHFRQAERATGMKFFYTNKAGEEIGLDLPNDQLEIVLDDNVQGSEFTYTTCFLPDTMCVDIFEAAYKTEKFPIYDGGIRIDRSDWEIIDYSSEGYAWVGPIDGYAMALLDDNLSTFWHSDWQTPAPLPHHITFDMKQVYEIREVEVYRRLANTDTRKVVIELSVDNQTYEEVAILDFGTSTQDLRSALIPVTEARYLKVIVTESNRGANASLSAVFAGKSYKP